MNDSLSSPIEPIRPPRRTNRPWKAAALAIGFAAALAAPAEGGASLAELPYAALVDLEYFLETDTDTAAPPRPLCLLIAGGGSDWRTAQGVMRGLGPAFLQRGWAVAVPIAPEGRGFMGRNGRLVPKLVDELQTRKYITDDPVLVVGVSNGGIAAMEIAAEDPDQFAAVVAIPGVLSRDTKVRNLEDMPIYLRVGENDHLNWGRAIPEITQRLREAGALVDAKALQGQGHGITIDWTELDAWLQQALGENAPAALRAMAPPPGPTLRIPPSPNRPVRTWTSRTGATVNAALLQADSQAAVLQTPAGRRIRIEYGQLSDADQQHLREVAGGGMMPPN